MNDKEILDRLWEACRETPFATFSLQRKLDLRRDDLRAVLNLINDMADSSEVRSGYRIMRVASTMYKLISQAECDSDSPKGTVTEQAASTPHTTAQAQPSDCDTVKGKLLIDPQESLTGANTASFHEQLPENADFSINDPFPRGARRTESTSAVGELGVERTERQALKSPHQATIPRRGQNHRKGSTHR